MSRWDPFIFFSRRSDPFVVLYSFALSLDVVSFYWKVNKWTVEAM